MAATIVQIMTGLRDRLATISGLNTWDYAKDNPVVPAAFPLVPPIQSYRETMGRGTYVIVVPVAVLVGAQVDQAGQHALAGYANQTGATSIRQAIEGDRTLGGIVNDLVVDSFDTGGLQEVGLVGYYGGLFRVRVIASGV